jgi:hypothetical protein
MFHRTRRSGNENCRDWEVAATITGDRCKQYFQASDAVIGPPLSDPEKTVDNTLAGYLFAEPDVLA